MKLRIKGNTIRLRLSKKEVEQLCSEGIIREQTNFADASFVYSIQREINTDTIKATYKQNELVVYIPSALIKGWETNTIISFDNRSVDGSMPELLVLVEKDFKCIDNSTEDQTDNYENPKTC
jgi:hypothetical protein